MKTLQAPQLSSRLLRISLVWVLLLIASVLYTLFLSWRLEASTDVLHDAGKIRTELYSLTTMMKSDHPQSLGDVQGAVWRIDQLLQRVSAGDDTTLRVLPKSTEIHRFFSDIEERWKRNIKPVFLLGDAAKNREEISREKLAQECDSLNQDLHIWEGLIQADSSRNIVVLRYTQVALGGLSILSLIILMWFLMISVLNPLRQLQNGIERLRASDWKTRVHAEGSLEFSNISSGFNHLAHHLDDVYTNLENKVAEKTQSLAEKNVYLTSLYGLTAFLSEPHTPEELYESFMARILTLSQAQAGAVFLWDERRECFEIACSKSLTTLQHKDPVLEMLLFKSLESAYPLTYTLSQLSKIGIALSAAYAEMTIYHIRTKQKDIGVFVVFHSNSNQNHQGFDQLIETLGRHLGATIDNNRLTAIQQQLAVGEERNVMAQNLHDSIAQTLSFVNLQVQMLDNAVKANDKELIDDGLMQIKAGVQECYDDVRELLLNFRTRVTQEDFEDLVQTVLKRFERQTRLKAHLRQVGNGPALSAQQKLQAIFILQEALSNVRKHAEARNVLVTVKNEDDFVLTIMDDGVGIDEETLEERKQSHVGLSIMRERAQKVLGSIEIESEAMVGTTIRFTLSSEVRQPL